MASTAHKTDYEKEELFDSPEELDKKIEYLAKLVKNSKHMIAFTGAGLSTSAGVPDYRSGTNTVLPTGPGGWERQAQKDYSKPKLRVDTLNAIPTKSHMALVKLAEEGILKFLISQNTDGLHKRSGFPSHKIAELHGNSNLEKCWNQKCKREFFRDFHTCEGFFKDHHTSRKCESCGDVLHDSIINFGENLPQKELNDGFNNGKKADLVLCLGSSLKVTPAAQMPLEAVKNGGKMVIVNLQRTPLDEKGLRINALIDDVMVKLMEKLKMEIPRFSLRKRLTITKQKEEKKGEGEKVEVRGVDDEGRPFTLFREVTLEFLESGEKYSQKYDPFVFKPKCQLEKGEVRMVMYFFGHYGENSLTIKFKLHEFDWNEKELFQLDYDPENAKWTKITHFDKELK